MNGLCAARRCLPRRNYLTKWKRFESAFRLSMTTSRSYSNMFGIVPLNLLTRRTLTPLTFLEIHRGVSLAASSSSSLQCEECGTEASQRTRYAFFCSECLAVMPVDKSKTLFDVLNLPITYDVDRRAIAAYKRHHMKSLHPDKFAGSSDDVLRRAEDQSSRLNEAVETLTNPYSRGIYLLELNGTPVEEGTNPDLGQSFLLDMMTLNEDLEDIDNEKDADQMRRKLGTAVASMERELSEAFSGGRFNEEYTTVDLAEAKAVLEKMKFYINLEDKCLELTTRF